LINAKKKKQIPSIRTAVTRDKDIDEEEEFDMRETSDYSEDKNIEEKKQSLCNKEKKYIRNNKKNKKK
jgi:hypothetical protein